MTSALLPVFQPASMLFEHGEGAWLTTTDGERYLDFGAGIAVNALGYSHPHLVGALEQQNRKLWHLSNVYRIPGRERLAERLTAACFADVAFFANSGAEANECAIKIARRYQDTCGHPERWRIVTFDGAFHGRTLATMAAGGNRKYLDGFGPAVDGFDLCPRKDIEAVRACIGPQTAAIMIEPIQGESGIRPVSHSFLRQLRNLCDELGLLLIFDEIQCGMGRTGYLFAHQEAGTAPDIMSLAKGLGGGFPIGACVSTRHAARGMIPGTHGSTFGGNPLAVAVANAVLDIVLDEALLAEVRRKGDLARAHLDDVAGRFPDLIVEVRGRGLMLGIKTTHTSQEVVDALRTHAKVLTIAAGDNVTRVLPPLIVTDEEIHLFAERLDQTLALLSKRAETQIARQGHY
ncbi:aspartate aminotransferase family protein [Magnetospirillum molischianum]|uniref:Acetylornithine aminotransferase n=1 Tax=Magnetospirillum molischianum DSM 120 TaxID=1150626 RepID=H8FPZ5_MAGML|nr:aspartate aminotransferase family protein [Magnetospirillum molischianum]CCG40433.1 acetylornithine transaminase (NAcOATase and DapATase), PLP-dependent [Magnetospirillum molischianum DSM 120]